MTYSELLPSLFNVPNLILLSLMVLAFWVFTRAQVQSNLKVGEMIMDKNGKASSSRLAVLISLGLSSYLISYVVINKSLDATSTLYMFYAYIITWSSSKALEKFIEVWGSKGQRSNDSNDSRNSYDSSDYDGSRRQSYQQSYSRRGDPESNESNDLVGPRVPTRNSKDNNE